MADENNQNAMGPDQAELEGIIEPRTDELPELVGGQPQAPTPPDRSREPARPPDPDERERLNKALETIESLKREVTDLRGRPSQQVVYDTRGRDALPEMIEVLPGRKIPKDPDQRAIKLRAEDLVSMGWNEDPAKALNAFANAFFHHIAEVIPAITLAHLEEQGRNYRAGENRQTGFFNEYPDLREFGDLANIVEQQTMQELPIQGMTQGEWNRQVGTRVRQRIAAMRGITLDQYTASLQARPNGSARPRAVTAPGGRAPARQAPTNNDQQREMDAMMDGRFG